VIGDWIYENIGKVMVGVIAALVVVCALAIVYGGDEGSCAEGYTRIVTDSDTQVMVLPDSNGGTTMSFYEDKDYACVPSELISPTQ
jgi:hypothetical protein